MLVRRLVGPLTLWKDEKYPDWLTAEVVKWEAANKAAGELLANVQPG